MSTSDTMNNSGHDHFDLHLDPTDTINIPATGTDMPMADTPGMALGSPMGTTNTLDEHVYGMVMLLLQLH